MHAFTSAATRRPRWPRRAVPFLPGISGEDDGLKGAQRIDNGGRLTTRVPRTNLLNCYGDVAPDGTYTSPIASGSALLHDARHAVQGRASFDGSANNAAKMGLAIAVRYGNERRQFTGE